MIPRQFVKKKLMNAKHKKSDAYCSDKDISYRHCCYVVKILEDILDADLDFESGNKTFLRYHKKYHPKTKIKELQE